MNFEKIYLLVYLFIASFYFNGCATSAEPLGEPNADRKEALELKCENCWKIIRVVSAIKHKDGDISICARLVSPVKTESPRLKTITLPLSELTGIIPAGTKSKQSISESPFYYVWYPIEKTERGCDKIDLRKTPLATDLPIETLDVGRKFELGYKDRNKLYELLNSYNKDQQGIEKIYEVKSKFSTYVLLVYWPIQNSQQDVKPIIIAAVYDRNTKYYQPLYRSAFLVLFWGILFF